MEEGGGGNFIFFTPYLQHPLLQCIYLGGSLTLKVVWDKQKSVWGKRKAGKDMYCQLICQVFLLDPNVRLLSKHIYLGVSLTEFSWTCL